MSNTAEKETSNYSSKSCMFTYSWPRDVSNLNPSEYKYNGCPTEHVKRRQDVLLSVCHLHGADKLSKEVMFLLLQTTVLKQPALVYFKDVMI